MEHFNNTDSWIAMGRHKLGPLTLEPLDEKVKESFHLSTDDVYRVINLDGKTRDVTFEQWHGQHALFYSQRDDWRFIIHYTDLRRYVKRVKVPTNWEDDRMFTVNGRTVNTAATED